MYSDATLYRIIIEANNISNPEYITAGTTLMIPERLILRWNHPTGEGRENV